MHMPLHPRADRRVLKGRTMTMVPQGRGNVSRSGSGSLYDILELILDRGLVIDVFIRVSLLGIEILTIDIRIVVASVDTYLRLAEACNRLDLESGRKAPAQLTDIIGGTTKDGASGTSKEALSGAAEAVKDTPDSKHREPGRRERGNSRRSSRGRTPAA